MPPDKMEEILFTKMHGIGNDYIYIHCPGGVPSEISELSIEMSRRHVAVGSDGIILILPSDKADFMKNLKIKAGMNPSFWSDNIKVYRFRTVEIMSDEN